MKNLNTLFLVVCFVCLLTIGCGKKSRFPGVVSAEGTITYNGAALDDAKLLFYPTEVKQDNVVTVSQSDSNGRFVLRINGEVDGTYPGTYKVVVVKSKMTGYKKDEEGNDIPQYALATPQKYSTEHSTPLEVTIPPKGDKNIEIKLD